MSSVGHFNIFGNVGSFNPNNLRSDVRYTIFFSGSAVKFMKTFGGLQWTEVRRILKREFVRDDYDHLYLLPRIKVKCMKYVPVRSGELLDYILKTMAIIRLNLKYNAFVIRGFFAWEPSHPFPIPGHVRHRPPDTGYGKWAGVRLIHAIPNVHPIHVSATGLTAKYLLDDPNAYSNPIPILETVMKEEIIEDLKDRMSKIYIMARVDWVPYQYSTYLSINQIKIP